MLVYDFSLNASFGRLHLTFGCLCTTQNIMTIKRLGGAVKNIPLEWCELRGALNLFGCCCQPNEVRE